MTEKQRLSPLAIKVIIFYYVDGTGKDYPTSPAVKSITRMLIERKMLIIANSGSRRSYEPNIEMMNVFMDEICSTPFPVKKYTIDRNASSI